MLGSTFVSAAQTWQMHFLQSVQGRTDALGSTGSLAFVDKEQADFFSQCHYC